ncbi:Transposon Ty3-G Gag-Pol polyprotein [Trichinella nelsoni]|uniref:RNA-directed DNA polymerase n=1 Tax=Trichinella nelsoni TaxID=6336 RepID=A0A0V0RF78_9BILA|nr:Transposon Ty3-G Gag-Pol polyprotein [Trichinella nelsoni]
MAPAVYTPKKSGEVRICVDYRELNKKTRKDAYPLSLPGDIFDKSGFWQIPVNVNDKEKAAFSPGPGMGLFQFTRMPFGLTGALSTFQRAMDSLLKDLPFAEAYLDDIIIFSPDSTTHGTHLEAVFIQLRNAGLTLKGSKCKIGVSEVRYVFSAKGIAPWPSKTAAVKSWPVPADKTSLKRFFGLTSYYRRFMESYATIAAPLYELLKDDALFIWTENSQAAFDCLKNCLTSAPTLCTPNFDDSFQVTTDASGTGLGAILEQRGLIHKVVGSPADERSDGDDSRLDSNITAVFCRFGIPETLHSDQGATFESETLRLLLNSFGIKKTRTTPCHPQSDGLVERANRTLLQLFRTYMVKDADWEEHLPLMLYAYRTEKHASTGASPFTLMFGREAKTIPALSTVPDEWNYSSEHWHNSLARKMQQLYTFAKEHLTLEAQRQKEQYDRAAQAPPTLLGGTPVWIWYPRRGKFQPQWQGNPCQPASERQTRHIQPEPIDISHREEDITQIDHSENKNQRETPSLKRNPPRTRRPPKKYEDFICARTRVFYAKRGRVSSYHSLSVVVPLVIVYNKLNHPHYVVFGCDGQSVDCLQCRVCETGAAVNELIDNVERICLMLIILGCGVRSTVCQGVVVFDGCRLAVFSNLLDLPLWGFHLTMRAFGDCLWPAVFRYATELGLTRIEEGFLHSFWCIRWRPDQLLEWCRAVGGR